MSGVRSMWYENNWEGSGSRSVWAWERRWAVVGAGVGWRSLRGVLWFKVVLETS